MMTRWHLEDPSLISSSSIPFLNTQGHRSLSKARWQELFFSSSRILFKYHKSRWSIPGTFGRNHHHPLVQKKDASAIPIGILQMSRTHLQGKQERSTTWNWTFQQLQLLERTPRSHAFEVRLPIQHLLSFLYSSLRSSSPSRVSSTTKFISHTASHQVRW